ncbi:hypothetical protein J4E89_006994 [Alternaria sp. Ai002NY15]|nr:hypothetical protein J4E89_006994 [Alternaria sp. Ai002NY15]
MTKQRLQAQEEELSLETEQEAKAEETQHYDSASDSDSSQTVNVAPTGVLNLDRFASPATTKLRRKMWLSLSAHVELSKLLEAAKSSSDHHFDTWSNPKTLRRDPEMTQDGWEKAIEQHYQTWYDDTVKKLSAEVDAHSFSIRQWQITEEHGNMPKSETLPLIVQAETTTAHRRKLLIILRDFRNQMKGEYVDAHQQTDVTDLSYIGSITQRLVEPYQSPQVHKAWYKGPDGRDLDAPERFKKDAIDYYSSRFAKELSLWCPVARGYSRENEVQVVHLVHYNTGERACEYLFGKTANNQGHLMDPSNSLTLPETFKDALDRGQMIIVPACLGDIDPESGKKVNESDTEPYKIRLLDLSWKKSPSGEDSSRCQARNYPIDGRILKFKNDNRPKKMYLWYRALTAIAMRQRCKVPGWEHDVEALSHGTWTSPGESLRRSTMTAIMKHVGFIDDPEPISMLGSTLEGDPTETPYDKMIADRVAMILDTTHTNWLKSRRSAFARMHAGKKVEIDWEDEDQHEKFASWERCVDYYRRH